MLEPTEGRMCWTRLWLSLASISHFICFFVLQQEHTFWREGGLTMLEFTELCYKRMQYRWEGWHGFFRHQSWIVPSWLLQPLKMVTSSWSSMLWWAIRHGEQMSQTSPVLALDECLLCFWDELLESKAANDCLVCFDVVQAMVPRWWRWPKSPRRRGHMRSWEVGKKISSDIPSNCLAPTLSASRKLEARIDIIELFFKHVLIWGPGCMGKWGHRLNLGLTVTQKVAILPRTKVWLWHRWDLWRSVGQSPTTFSHHPHQTDLKYPTVACNSQRRDFAKMAAKTDKAWSHKSAAKVNVSTSHGASSLRNSSRCPPGESEPLCGSQRDPKRRQKAKLGSLQSRWQVPFYQSIHRFHRQISRLWLINSPRSLRRPQGENSYVQEHVAADASKTAQWIF